MEWKILIKKGESIFRIFKILQLANSDIIIAPHKSIYLDRSFIFSKRIGDKLIISTKNNEAIISHYSAHSKTGQRHVKYIPEEAKDPVIGSSFKSIDTIIPLVSIVATTNRAPDGEQEGKWIGFNLPNETDCCILDLHIAPFAANLSFKFEQQIANVKKTLETIDYKIMPLRFCNVILFIRTSNHNSCKIPYNLLLQQVEGVTAQIIRVSNNEVEVDMSNLSIESKNKI